MKNVLVVDAEEKIRLLYKEGLEEDGYRVSLASSAAEAMEKISDDPPDLIALQKTLPDMDGIEFINRLREKNKDVPIVLCSTEGRYKQNFKVWASGACVVKSADLGELKLSIKEIFAS